MIIDASSAILLYKTGWMEPLMASYRVVAGPAVLREITATPHPGARAFARWQREHRFVLQPPPGTGFPASPGTLHLGPGERECIELFRAGAGVFILIDDGPGAAFCRREAIPYVNALLVPRLLRPDEDGPRLEAELSAIFRLGRYAPWIMTFARTCSREQLSFFYPEGLD